MYEKLDKIVAAVLGVFDNLTGWADEIIDAWAAKATPSHEIYEVRI